MLGLFRTSIAGSTVAGLVGATAVENIFFGVVGGLVYLWLFLGVAGSFDVKLGWFADHWGLTLIIIVAGGLLIGIVGRMLWHRLQETWENAKEGGAILRTPRTFFVQVVGVEALSYVARMGVNATFMYAYDIPVSVQNVFLIVAAASVSSTVAIAPGAVGAQTALASVVLNGVAPQATISAYTIGQSLITTAWNAVFGLTMLARTIGWEETRKLIHRKKKQQDGETRGGGDGSRRERLRPASPSSCAHTRDWGPSGRRRRREREDAASEVAPASHRRIGRRRRGRRRRVRGHPAADRRLLRGLGCDDEPHHREMLRSRLRR